jgi:AraC family transcriptional regulator
MVKPGGEAMSERLAGGQFLGRLIRRRAVGGLSLSETRYAPGTRLPRHSHEHGYFCLVRRGTFCEEYGGRQRSCGPLTLAFHPPGEMHAEEIGRSEVWSFNIEVAPSWPVLAGSAVRLDWPFDTRAEPLVGLAVQLFHEFHRPDASSALVIEGLTLQLLGLSLRAAGLELAGAPPAWLQRVRDLLNECCPGPPDLSDLAADAGVHPGYLTAAFRRHFGCSVGDYARRRRVLLACQHLANTARPLAEIACETGFADQSHFTRMFKRVVGVTPAAYRRTAGRTKT